MAGAGWHLLVFLPLLIITIMLQSIMLYSECVEKARQSRTALLSTGPVYDVMIKV